MGFMKDQFKQAKNDKFNALFEAKPALNPLVHCAFHPSEGCTDCLYINRCSIKEGGFFV